MVPMLEKCTFELHESFNEQTELCRHNTSQQALLWLALDGEKHRPQDWKHVVCDTQIIEKACLIRMKCQTNMLHAIEPQNVSTHELNASRRDDDESDNVENGTRNDRIDWILFPWHIEIAWLKGMPFEMHLGD